MCRVSRAADHIEARLSKGCQMCQTGRWVCIFLTYLCQADCSFCPAPHKDDRVWTEYGNRIEHIAAVLKQGHHLGVGFSGGDCFLTPLRLENWLKRLHSQFPEIYYWVYTNGLAARPHLLARIAESGMNEIRFNLAATGYDHPVVMEHMHKAVELFEHVAIEIPSIPEHASKLMQVLPLYDQMGVKFLNLHEWILRSDDVLYSTAEKKVRPFNLCGRLEYDGKSRENTAGVIAFCRKNNLSFIVNDCSIDRKEIQMRHRRINNAARYCRPWERVTPEGLLETCCKAEFITQAKEDPDLLKWGTAVHPDQYGALKNLGLIRFMPPMDSGAKRIFHSAFGPDSPP